MNFPQELVELSVEARQGDSGGPIFNDRGELAGVLFGASRGTTLGSYAGRVQNFLAGVVPTDSGAPPDALLAAASPPRTNHPTSPSQPAGGGFSESLGAGGLVPVSPSADRVGELRNASPPGNSIANAADPWAESFSSVRTASGEIQMLDAPPRRSDRSTAGTAADSPSLAASIPGTPSETSASDSPRSITWSDLAGEGYLEQTKTLLAVIGVFAILFMLLRNR